MKGKVVTFTTGTPDSAETFTSTLLTLLLTLVFLAPEKASFSATFSILPKTKT